MWIAVALNSSNFSFLEGQKLRTNPSLATHLPGEMRAGEGNRTPVFSLGSASRLIASSLRMGCFAWSALSSSSAVVVRCCAVLHPVERCSRHELGTECSGDGGVIEAARPSVGCTARESSTARPVSSADDFVGLPFQ